MLLNSPRRGKVSTAVKCSLRSFERGPEEVKMGEATDMLWIQKKEDDNILNKIGKNV